jgi:predicted MPP superfamily phosphohydrolase
MKKSIVLLSCILFLIQWSNAQKLSFREDGTFKIVQFTDAHIAVENPEYQVAIKTISETLDAEKPDLVIFSGDVVTGKPATPGWREALGPVSERNIPFMVVLGNHDDEQDLSRPEIAKIVTSYEGNMNQLNKKKELADLVLTIKDKKGKNGALLYCMDSNAYSTIDTVRGYGWFTFDQVEWYRETSQKYTKDNQNKTLPSLAFFHIPLPEYKQAFENEKKKPVGQRLENECAPKLNTGMFAAFLECGDVMGTFVGHDHNNDYVAELYGIALCYGRFTGGKTTYTDIPNGARIIQLKEGNDSFTTWIRLSDGSEIDRISFPDAFR